MRLSPPVIYSNPSTNTDTLRARDRTLLFAMDSNVEPYILPGSAKTILLKFILTSMTRNFLYSKSYRAPYTRVQPHRAAIPPAAVLVATHKAGQELAVAVDRPVVPMGRLRAARHWASDPAHVAGPSVVAGSGRTASAPCPKISRSSANVSLKFLGRKQTAPAVKPGLVKRRVIIHARRFFPISPMIGIWPISAPIMPLPVGRHDTS